MASGIITLKMLQSALDDVRDELCEMDLLTKCLEEVDVQLVSPLYPEIPYGYYLEGSHFILDWLGWKEGNIYIPSVKYSTLLSIFGYGDSFSLRHVLRHEYGHALAHRHPRMVRRSVIFWRTYNGGYDQDYSFFSYHKNLFVSEYAATKPQEDFAETFALYVRKKGDISRYRKRHRVYSKLRFIKDLNKKTIKLTS